MGESSEPRVNAPESAPTDMWEWLSERESDVQPTLTTSEEIDRLIGRIKQKQNEFHKNRTKYVGSIIRWLHKFKDIGDIVPSFDPIHAALRLLGSTPRFLSSGRVPKRVSTQEPIQFEDAQDGLDLKRQYLDKLHNDLTSFYSKSMSVLRHWGSNLIRNQIRRKMAAVLNLSEQVDILSELEAQRKQVIECGEACERVLNHRISNQSRLTPREPINEVPQVPLRIDKREQVRPQDILDLEEIKRNKTEDTRHWTLRENRSVKRKRRNSKLTVLYGDRIHVFHFCALVQHATADSNKPLLISKVATYSTSNMVDNKATAFFYCKRGESNRRKSQYILCCILRQISSSGLSLIRPSSQGVPRILSSHGITFDTLSCQYFMGRLMKAIYLSQRPSQNHRLCKRRRNMLEHQPSSLPKRGCNFGFEAPLLKTMSTFGLFPLFRGWGQKVGVEFNMCDLKGLSLSLVFESSRDSSRLFLMEKNARMNCGSPSPMAIVVEAFFIAALNNFIKCGTKVDLVQNDPVSAISPSHHHADILDHLPTASASIDGKHKLILKRSLVTHTPLYYSMDELNPTVCMNKAGYEITKSCVFYQTGHCYYLPRSWFLIMWELRTTSEPQAPFLSQLQQWGFPGTLPRRLTVVAKLTSISGDQPNSFLIISAQGGHSQLGIVPAQQKDKPQSRNVIESARWKPCISRDIGVANITNQTPPTTKIDLLEAEVAAALKKTAVYIDSQYDIPLSWVLIAFSVGLLAWIFGL